MPTMGGMQDCEALAQIYHETIDSKFDDVEIDMGNVNWFDADLCAPFGAILYSISQQLNNVQLVNLIPHVRNALARNGFLSYYGSEWFTYGFGTTIEYKRFDVKDDRYFAEYIQDKLMRRTEIPNMSDGLRKKFQESIFEIFNNAVIHSGTKHGIFSCGQYFPKRQWLNFTIADLGVGIPWNVRQFQGLHDLAAAEAIDWATSDNNTTKRGSVPGGLGLKLLREFINKNEGEIQIVSDLGYWECSSGPPKLAAMERRFPGTFVRICINTGDTNSYALDSERSNSNIL